MYGGVYGAFQKDDDLIPVVYPISADIVDEARSLLDDHESLGARGALHAAVVIEFGLDAICSYDRGFDHLEISRSEPEEFLQAVR